MRAVELISETPLKLSNIGSDKAQDWIDKVYDKFQPWPLDHNQRVVVVSGTGEDQHFAWFELVPSKTKPNAVEIKWLSAHPQRKGVGTIVLRQLQDLAAADGISLTLYPWDKGTVSQSQLTKFYRKSGFTPDRPGSKNMSWPPTLTRVSEVMAKSSKLPIITLGKLFHVGSLNAKKKGKHSYEGNGLSVSTHPDAWRRIARGQVSGDTFSANKTANRFLNAHALTNKHTEAIANWAVQQGYLLPTGTVTVSWFDDEMDSELSQEFLSMAKAKQEFGDLEDYTVSVNKKGYSPTAMLKKITKNLQMTPTGVLEYVLPLYAEEMGLDGVWWNDRLDVQKYSAPRGVIVPSKISTWTFTKIKESLHEGGGKDENQ